MSQTEPENFTFPILTPDEDAVARGTAPDTSAPRPPTSQSAREDEAVLEKMNRVRATRFRQDSLLPHLLIRAMPGDHAKRPVASGVSWWNTPCILVAEHNTFSDWGVGKAAGPPNIDHPIAGTPYDIFVRVFNLGLLAAVGATLEAWWSLPNASGFTVDNVNPIDPTRQRNTMNLDPIGDCNQFPECIGLFKLPVPWVPQVGHECIIARVTCTADSADPTGANSPVLDPVSNRRVAQRNYVALPPHADLTATISALIDNLATDSILRVSFGVMPLSLEAFRQGARARATAPEAARLSTSERTLTEHGALSLFAVSRSSREGLATASASSAAVPISEGRIITGSAPHANSAESTASVVEAFRSYLGVRALTGAAIAQRLNATLARGVATLTFEGFQDGRTVGGYSVLFA